MPLPHYTQLSVGGFGPGSLPQEPVYLNLFEITFIFPTILQAQGRSAILLLEQATSIELNLTPQIEIEQQKFKYSTRAFMKTPEKTHIEFDIKFNVNVTTKGSMEVWNTLRAWYDLVHNTQNGILHYKSDMIGTIIVNQHDRKGVVLRRVTFNNCQMMSLGGYALGWESAGDILKDLVGKWCADFWVDEFIDSNFTIAPPLVPGY